jgi:hypothetical protein
MTDSKTDDSKTPVRIARVLEQCRDIVLVFSDAQMSELFENAGAALLDFAERAENNTIQGRFFEAMSFIQQRRADIEQTFRRHLSDGFDEFARLTPERAQLEQKSGPSEESELTLVDRDEMEEDVAAQNLIIRANADFFPELYALSQRLSAVRGGAKHKDSSIPATPHHLVYAFRRSIKGLEVEVKVKVILYALFDKYVLAEAKSIYDEINSSLKAAGILPNLKPVHVRSPEGTDQPRSRRRGKQVKPSGDADADHQHPDAGLGPGGGSGDSLGSELFQSIIELMSTRRPTARYGSARQDARAARPVAPGVSADSTRRLMSALDTVQAGTTTRDVADLAQASGAVPNLEIDDDFLKKIKVTLSEEREQALSQIDRANLSPIDADLIDLIGMLFEYMLNDPVLPNLAKALLSHLHTPYLKVALIDRQLLVDAQHPARRLLDQLVESGSIWVDESNPQRGIFPAMQRIVDRVLVEFSNDVSLFETLLDAFEADMNDQQRRTETMEQRTQETARGREKLQLAKRRAGHQIKTLLQRQVVPDAVAAFLGKTWHDHLVFILLRDKRGERGEAWQKAVDTSEKLVGLFSSAPSPSGKDQRSEEVAAIKAAVSEGILTMGSYSRAALDALYDLLDAPDSWQRATKAAASSRAQAAVAGQETGQEAAPTPGAEDTGIETVSEQEQEVMQRLRKMKFGTWFELTSGPGAPPRRIKLSWLSPLTSTCMFVDRSGMQAEIKTLHEMAREMLAGRAKVIPRPKHPFIERALVSIRKMLQGDESVDSDTAAGP